MYLFVQKVSFGFSKKLSVLAARREDKRVSSSAILFHVVK